MQSPPPPHGAGPQTGSANDSGAQHPFLNTRDFPTSAPFGASGIASQGYCPSPLHATASLEPMLFGFHSPAAMSQHHSEPSPWANAHDGTSPSPLYVSQPRFGAPDWTHNQRTLSMDSTSLAGPASYDNSSRFASGDLPPSRNSRDFAQQPPMPMMRTSWSGMDDEHHVALPPLPCLPAFLF